MGSSKRERKTALINLILTNINKPLFNSKYLPATVYNNNKENSLYYNSMQLCLCLKFESSEQNILHFDTLNVIQLRVCLKFESSPCLSRRMNGIAAAGFRRHEDSVSVSQCKNKKTSPSLKNISFHNRHRPCPNRNRACVRVCLKFESSEQRHLEFEPLTSMQLCVCLKL